MSTQVWTSVAPGLRKKNNQDGSVSYQSIIYFDGGSGSETKSHPTEAEAKRWHRERQTNLDKGLRPTRKDMRLIELKREAFAYHESEIARDGGKANGVVRRTLDGYEDAFKRVEGHPIWNQRLDRIDSVQAVKFLRHLRTLAASETNPNGYAWTTLNQTWTVVRNVLRYGREEGYMHLDPFAGTPRKLRPPQEPDEKNVKQPLSPSELRRFLAVLETEEFLATSDTLYANAAIQSFCEGERATETCLTKWGDLDLVDGVLITRGTKNARSKKRPQMAQAATVAGWERQLEHEVAKGLGNEDDFVYTVADGSGRPIDRYGLRGGVKRAGKLAGLGHVTTMNGRKTTSTADHYGGVDEEVSAAAHGHGVDVRRNHYVMTLADREVLREMRDRRARFLGITAETE